MFEILKSIFVPSGDEKAAETEFSTDDLRLAEAALMFHVIQSDGSIIEVELQRMKKILTSEYGLSEEQMNALIEAARAAENEAVDLYRFTSLLKRSLDRKHLVQIVENLWEMVYADGVVHELEDNVVWRIAELLDIGSHERMKMKRRVRARRTAKSKK